MRVRFPIPTVVGGLLTMAALLTGCATGERPTLTSEPLVTDDASDAVADLLAAPATEFTATYLITPSTPNVDPREATVAHQGQTTRVSVGTVDFLLAGEEEMTCINSFGECFNGILDGYVSDLNITHAFWNGAFQQRLRSDAARRIGTSETFDTTIADRPATCANLQVVGGSVVYCANPLGIAARYGGADTAVELQTASEAVDTVFLRPATPPVTDS